MVRAAAWPAVLALLLLSRADAEAAPRKPLFAADETLHLTIRGPLARIPRDDKTGPVPGTLTVEGAAPESLPILLSSRGITRRRRDVCSFPPLRVEFKDKPAAASIFRGQKRLKLVTHCQPARNNQSFVLLEYAAYRLYASLTPQSFAVRLARIDYIGDDGQALTTRLGFFIEDIDDVAHRNGQERLRGATKIAVDQLNPAAAARFAVFQYMISNLDWSMTAAPPGEDCCHNARLAVVKGATTDIIPIPYDFDYAGLVDAPYAVPPAGISVRNVRVRRYRGYCRHNQQAQAVSADLLARRADLLTIVSGTPELDAFPRDQAVTYLNGFFQQIASVPGLADMLKECLH